MPELHTLVRVADRAIGPGWWDLEVNQERVANHGYLWFVSAKASSFHLFWCRSLKTGALMLWHEEELEVADG